MLTLYHANHSTCSQKVRLCLAEKRLEWTSKLINLATNEHLTPEYLALNPNGVVPTLVHDGAVIRDFVEGADLLQDLNLDALERAAPVGDSLPRGFDPVVRGTDGRAWLAARTQPVGVLVPGPPLGRTGAVGDVSRILFFNGLRQIIGQSQSSPFIP